MLINRNFLLTHKNDSDFTPLPTRIRFAAASLFWKKDDLPEEDFEPGITSGLPVMRAESSGNAKPDPRG